MILVIAGTVFVHQALLYVERKRFDAFDGLVLLDAVVLLICVYGALLDDEVRRFVEGDASFALMLYGGLIALYGGLHFPWGRGPLQSRLSGDVAPRTGVLAAFSAVYVVVSVLQLRQWAAAAGGVMPWLTGPRTLLYGQALEGGAGAILSILGTASRVGILVFIAVAMRQRRYTLAAVLYLTTLACIFVVFTTRTEVLMTLLLPVFYYHYTVRPLAIWKVVSVGALVLVLLAALNLYRVMGTGIDLETGVGLAQLIFEAGSQRSSEYFARPLAILWALREQGLLPLEYGLNYIYIFLTFIPRALWPEKPVTSFENRWTTLTQGGLADETGGARVWVFTAWGEGLAQFDLPGVLVNLFLYGIIVRMAMQQCRRHPDYVLVLAFVSIFSALFLRGGVQSLAVMVILHIGTLRLIEKIVYRTGDQREVSTTEPLHG